MLPPSTRRPTEDIGVRSKRIQELSEFSKSLEEFRLMIGIMKKEPLKNERKIP
jgi:hypothetical protein